MTPSQKCADFIKSFEQCRLKAYLPTPNDVPTIGWGSTGSDIKLGMTWTQEQADGRFERDLAHFGERVAAELGGIPATQDQFDAMVSLAYNIGIAAFAKSTVLRKHKSGEFDAAASAFSMWTKQAGKVLNGLVRRRTAEARMYRSLPA